MPRCAWCTDDPIYIRYHDEEWGVPQRDPAVLFELLVLEGFQAGLSWLIVLRRRDYLRQVLHGFDPQRLAALSDADIGSLLQDPGLIRNRLKLRAARQNAQAWLRLDSPAEWLWSFVGGQPHIHHPAHTGEVPVFTPEAEAMSKALKKAGFSFVGPTICYALMQSAGMVMDHTLDCPRHAELSRAPR